MRFISTILVIIISMLLRVDDALFSAPSHQMDGITDATAILNIQPQPLPPVGEPFIDPVFGTTITRLTDATSNNTFGTHIYSQLQAFSADSQYVLLIENDEYTVRRLADFSRVPLDTRAWNAPRRHPTQADTIVHFDSNDDMVVRLQFTNIESGTTETVFTFPPQYQFIRNNQSFDELSEDGRWLAGMLTRDDGESVIFSLDLENRVLGVELAIGDLYADACLPDPQWGILEPDWIGVSPLGNTLVVQWERDGIERCSGLETFDLQSGEFIGRVYDGHQHGDLGVTEDGREFFMTFELSSPMDNNRPAIGMRMLPGEATVSEPIYLLVIDWADDGHISCRGPHGVCLVTQGGWPDDGWTPFEKELFLISTDGAVQRLTHHRSSSCGYWVQPRASMSHDGRYVIFASDWALETGADGCSASELGQGEAYIIDLQAGR